MSSIPPKDYQAPDKVLLDRVILVTGAGNGIGRAVALAAGTHGATVILLGKTLRKLESVYDAIEAAGGPTPAIYPLNLEGATESDFDTLGETLEKEFGHLDGLLHNAAKLGVLSRIDDYDMETWYQILQVNLNGPMMLTRACLPLLRKSKDASVVLTGDKYGRHGRAYWGAYGVSKAAIEGFMRILAHETEGTSPIRVNSFDPGPTRTQLRLSAFPAEDHSQLKAPEILIPAYLWLLGPASSGITGQQLSFEE